MTVLDSLYRAPAGDRRIEARGAALDIRGAVGFCQRSFSDGLAVYLSIYDSELEGRADRFWDALSCREPQTAVRSLELTDAVFFFRKDGHVWLGRGGAATFPLYWRRAGDRVVFATRLPVGGDNKFYRGGLVAAVAGACLHSSYEPNAFTETPLHDWRRIRRSAFVRFDNGEFQGEEFVLHEPGQSPPSRDEVSASLVNAMNRYASSQQNIRSSLLEVSGGFDSTLAAAPLARESMNGVSVGFPYYEFRFEDDIQQAVADFLSISRLRLDGTDLLPYTPTERPLRFDEPSVFVTGMRHAEVVAAHAAGLDATCIYMGHGGDQCFATDLTTVESLVDNPPSSGPFSKDAWHRVKGAIGQIRHSPLMHRRSGAFVYDARQDVWIKETFGVGIRTPFTDLDVFYGALAWSQYCRAQGIEPDKSILAEAFPDLLPAAVLDRKGKVAYDGVWMRAYRRQENHIAGLFERTAPVLEHLGVSPDWLIRRVRALAAWQECSDREVLALYAVSNWLDAWNILDPADVSWDI